MFNIGENSIVYVICPAYNKTGGTELAHQLVYELNQIGLSAYITYDGDEGLNPAFELYVHTYKLIQDIQDERDNVLILPEIYTDLTKRFSEIQIGIWWMSVDNFLKNKQFSKCAEILGMRHALKCLLRGRVKLSSPKVDVNFMHLYQSEYAKNFLLLNGVQDMHQLSDYINCVYFEEYMVVDRSDEVLYNPRKGKKFTQELIKASQGQLAWKPIQNMSTEEVRTLLRTSKVYVDFGNHPGKDRFPREAAISGCCVVTGRRGAANYYEDIAISDKYKFNDEKKEFTNIINRINECIQNYEQCSLDFDEYRRRIVKEYDIFVKDVQDIFGYNSRRQK